MKVLVTGGTGAVGMGLCRRLARAGIDAVVMARRQPTGLPPGVRFVAGDIRDAEAVAHAVSGCDAVVHLAWYMAVQAPKEVIGSVNVGGTLNLLQAIERAGCRRLVFTSSTTVYGDSSAHPAPFTEDEPPRPAPSFLYAAHKAQVEQLIAERDLDAVIARATVVMGRGVDNEASQAYAGPVLLDIGGRSVVQAVHQDDVGRFLEQAVVAGWRGTVNLTAPGSLTMAQAGELLGRRVVQVSLATALRMGRLAGRVGLQIDEEVARVLGCWPVASTSRLIDEWGFVPTWSQEEILRDQGRYASRSIYLMPGKKQHGRPWRLHWASTTPLDPKTARPDAQWVHAAPEGVRGSFDTMIDPAYPLYSGTNLHEAFPGPMTPLSLELALIGMRAASDGLVKLFGLQGETAQVMRLGIGSFGHRLYVNVSSARLMADLVPGASVEDVDRMYLGIDSPTGRRPRLSPADAVAAAKLAGRIAPRVWGYSREAERLAADAVRLGAVEVSSLDDERLLAHLSLVHDMVCQGWNTSSTGNFLLAGLGSALQSPESGSTSAAALRGVQRLAQAARRRPGLRGALDEHGQDPHALEFIRREHPEFARQFDALVAECGHRGPGETELENDVFADRPELLLDVVRRAADRQPDDAGASCSDAGRMSPSARLARRVLHGKERSRDAVVRLIHAFRLAGRERGRRLSALGLLAQPADVFYLTYEELFASVPPGGSVVEERRAERRRLAGYRMPLVFERVWAPAGVVSGSARAGDVLRGIGAVPGSYEGVVRIMTSVDDDLESGEVLVAHVTDVGWTPFFSLAGAVVTDVGGMASHAAIVAREHRIPSVVGTNDATQRLSTGMRVRVDGAAGTVEVLGST
jgi:nucleoside-diphosphate-sugar epimerase/phosphohistidine swiveling domain-containing protein